MIGVIGKKVGTTQFLQENGELVGVTVITAGPCVVTQVKSQAKDGYNAVQLGFGVRKEKNIKKPQKGHFKKLGNFEKVREFRVLEEEANKLKTGNIVNLDSFIKGDKIQVTSTSKGKGFQGVVKRHGFKGSKKTHGNKDQLRMPGSIGATGPAHVFKGTRMGGRMGGDRVTIKNLKVIDIDLENNILFINGPVSGARNSLVLISGDGELVVKSEKLKIENDIKDIKKEDKKEDKKENKTEVKTETPEEVEKEVVEAKEKIDKKKKIEK